MKQEGIQFQVCRNPDVKFSCIERAHRTIRDKLFKYFVYKNSYRYIDVLTDFVKGYNATVHSSTGMAPANVTDSDVLATWKRLQKKRTRVIKAKYSVGQHVRISKEKAKFAKSAEQNFSTEIFRIVKVITRSPRPVYELEDLTLSQQTLYIYHAPSKARNANVIYIYHTSFGNAVSSLYFFL